MKKLLATLTAFALLFTLMACAKDKPKEYTPEYYKKTETEVLITIDTFIMKDLTGKTVKDYFDILVEKSDFKYELKNNMLTSLFDKVNTDTAFWLIYTNDLANANAEWGTCKFNDITYTSATLGVSELPLKENNQYLFAYTVFNIPTPPEKSENYKLVNNYFNSVNDFIKTKVVTEKNEDLWYNYCMAKTGVKDNAKTFLDAAKLFDFEKANLQATDFAKYSLVIKAYGENPEDFGDKHLNLIEKMYKNQSISGQATQAAWALITLNELNITVPDAEGNFTKEKLIAEIIKLSDTTNGGFIAWGKFDPDTTGMALKALSPFYSTNTEVKQTIDLALTALSTAQTDDGNFASWGNSNACSSATVLEALSILNINIFTDARFIKNDKTILDGIIKFKLIDGSYKFSLKETDTKTNSMATYQVFLSYDALLHSNFINL